MKYLPPTSDKNKPDITDIFNVKGLNEMTPLQNFERQFKKGHFTLFREK